MRRTLIEIAVFVLLALAGWGFYQWSSSKWDQRLEAQAAGAQKQLDQAKAEAEAWAKVLADGDAEVAFRSFIAGIQPALTAGRRDAVESAVGSFVQLPDVTFIHILNPDGSVIASTDLKLIASGEAGPRSAWALEAKDLIRREDERGILELAAPVHGIEAPLATVWLGYDVARRLERTKPTTAEPGPTGSTPKP
jgi:hypothetical protein